MAKEEAIDWVFWAWKGYWILKEEASKDSFDFLPYAQKDCINQILNFLYHRHLSPN